MKNKILGRVSYYQNAKDAKSQTYFEIDEILRMIKTGDGNIASRTAEVKSVFSLGTKEKYNEVKINLPMFCASGEFSHRDGKISSLKTYSNMLVLDFDWKTPDPEVVGNFRKRLISKANSLHLYAVWSSPAKGVKALLLHSNRNPLHHTELFYQVRDKLFKGEEAWDNACKDISRPCFICYDPEIFINTDPELKEFQFSHNPSYPTISTKIELNPNLTTSQSAGEFKHTSAEIKANQVFQKSMSDKTLLNRLKKIHDAENPDYYKDGHRHNEVKRRAVLYCRDGILYENALQSLKGQFGPNTKASWPENKIESIVQSCYNLARGDFGKDGFKFRTQLNKGKDPTPFQKKDSNSPDH